MSTVITKEEFIKKYGKRRVKFSSYYKYAFHFQGDLIEGGQVRASVGGCSDDIYRLAVVSNTDYSLDELDPDWGSILCGGQVSDEFYDAY